LSNFLGAYFPGRQTLFCYNFSTMIEKGSGINKHDIIAELVKHAYTKTYKMRLVGPGSVEATIPGAIVEREAKRHGLSVEEFIKVYRVEYLFGDFSGAFIRFTRQPSGHEEPV